MISMHINFLSLISLNHTFLLKITGQFIEPSDVLIYIWQTAVKFVVIIHSNNFIKQIIIQILDQ